MNEIYHKDSNNNKLIKTEQDLVVCFVTSLPKRKLLIWLLLAFIFCCSLIIIIGSICCRVQLPQVTHFPHHYQRSRETVWVQSHPTTVYLYSLIDHLLDLVGIYRWVTSHWVSSKNGIRILSNRPHYLEHGEMYYQCKLTDIFHPPNLPLHQHTFPGLLHVVYGLWSPTSPPSTRKLPPTHTQHTS